MAVACVPAIPSVVSRCWSSDTSSSGSGSALFQPHRHLQLDSRWTVSNPWSLGRTDSRQLTSTRTYAASDASSSNEGVYLPDLQVPRKWVSPENAAKEAEWLRGALHQWLDDEFCPEPPNEEISRRCAKVYYYCLLEEQLDVGDILMQMVRDLETFSFKHSFHGAFSSANAAIALITTRMREGEPSTN
jgi:hypothetical protein